jgi:hypothetical protein
MLQTCAHKGTPTAALEIVYGVEPLDLYLREAAAWTFVRLGQPTGSTDSGHLAKLNKMIQANCRNSSYEACTPIRVWEKNFKADISHGLDDTLNSNAYRAYTDGSLTPGNSRAGAGAIIRNNKQLITSSRSLTNQNSVFQSEIYAIQMAAD